MIQRLSAGANSGRAASAEKELERLRSEGTFVEKPFVPKKRSFRFPPVEAIGQRVVDVQGMSHGYNGQQLFRDVDLSITKGERLAIIGPNGVEPCHLLPL